jgi:hypothetical protein
MPPIAVTAGHRGAAGAMTQETSMTHSTSIRPTPFLRRVLFADAGISAAVGALMAAGAGPLQRLTGLPATLLIPAGLALLPYAAYLVWAATRPTLPRAAVWVPIVLNALWAVDCALVALGGVYAPGAFGLVFLAVQAVTVLVFAELEFIGLRRAPSALAG